MNTADFPFEANRKPKEIYIPGKGKPNLPYFDLSVAYGTMSDFYIIYTGGWW